MPRFFSGDELGAVKSVTFTPGENQEWKSSTSTLVPGESSHERAVQRLTVYYHRGSEILLAAAHAKGVKVLKVADDGAKADVVHQWDEPRLKQGQRFVGLAVQQSAVYSCTSNGALRRTKIGEEGAEPSSSLATLPMRLRDWRSSATGDVFAYGGEEVHLSVWDTERAFAEKAPSTEISQHENKKRKRGDQLLPGELWRAKNLPNDPLGLRRPVDNTALAFLQPSNKAVQHHLVAGTASGNIQRYDTRAGGRPVADWKGAGKTGGIGWVEVGSHEHELFVADQGCSLSAMDLRSGRTIYTYKGFAGVVSSAACAGSFLASTSDDRFLRLHSTFAPPSEVGQQQDHKGEVLSKVYMKVVPTVVAWDGLTEPKDIRPAEGDEDAADDIWETMQAVDSETEDRGSLRKEKRTKMM
ncbi:uncharacterized protein BXZ73DRAFT_37265 [Epithele typhae]|uniref:uncharacterized protein n=1 Tax=Epithele typhae TaxID=378194 RepID=UPI002008BE32|nr:uncharacterized protein BXZ73DRAFT_37265 [Epithele typhae]KAH9946206.1 hypothetical protein BXZ73DRAFT_37265 [Epithele typhae]